MELWITQRNCITSVWEQANGDNKPGQAGRQACVPVPSPAEEVYRKGPVFSGRQQMICSGYREEWARVRKRDVQKARNTFEVCR